MFVLYIHPSPGFFRKSFSSAPDVLFANVRFKMAYVYYVYVTHHTTTAVVFSTGNLYVIII